MYRNDFALTSVGVQSLFQSLGNNGCYLFALLEAGRREANESYPFTEMLQRALHSSGIVFHPENYKTTDAFYVKDAEELLKDVFGGRWRVTRGIHRACEKRIDATIIYHYVWKDSNKISYSHFRLKDWDSLQCSKTVLFGEIEDYRIVEYLGM